MSKLRKAARGQPCLVRIPGVCNGDPETTVLAHWRAPGLAGMGQKPHDLIGAWACSACHDEVDGRTRRMNLGLFDRHAAMAAGMARTIDALAKAGMQVSV